MPFQIISLWAEFYMFSLKHMLFFRCIYKYNYITIFKYIFHMVYTHFFKGVFTPKAKYCEMVQITRWKNKNSIRQIFVILDQSLKMIYEMSKDSNIFNYKKYIWVRSSLSAGIEMQWYSKCWILSTQLLN